MSAPSSVSNERLFNKTGQLRDKLKIRTDYIGVNGRVWWLFMHVHGGGPAICREELDIYSAEVPPETELYLDDLRRTGKGAGDLSRSLSRQFVDECHGDAQAYERQYGRPPSPPPDAR